MSPSAGSQPDTVAILGLDGHVAASATFQRRTVPLVPDARVVLQSVAQVVGSGVYYIDAAGTVRLLRTNSQPNIVARFSLKPAQTDAWFAVSPDGSRVVAGIVSLPPVATMTPGASWTTWDGQWDFRLMTAVNGAIPTESLTWSGGPPADLSFESTHTLGNTWPTFPIAWSSAGPVAMYPVALATKGNWPGGQLQLIRFPADGVHEDQLGGDDCFAASISLSGLIPCISAKGTVSVRDSAGKLAWATHVDSVNAQWLHLSPDGQAISDRTKVETRAGVTYAMPNGFRIQGWLDNNTLIGRLAVDAATDGNLAWVSLSEPAVVHDLGIQGDFVAPLTQPE